MAVGEATPFAGAQGRATLVGRARAKVRQPLSLSPPAAHRPLEKVSHDLTSPDLILAIMRLPPCQPIRFGYCRGRGKGDWDFLCAAPGTDRRLVGPFRKKAPGGKGDWRLLCAAPAGPFPQKVPVPFSPRFFGYRRKVILAGGVKMGEQLPLVRQWLLLRTLSARRCGATLKELVQELGVSEKTVRRDLETFQAVGFPLVGTVERFGRKTWRIEPAKSGPGLCFAFDEAVALYLGRRFLEPLAGTVFWQAAQQAFQKIRASLGKQALEYIEQFAAVFHQTIVGASDYAAKADLIDDLMVAIEDRRAVFIAYQSLRATEPVSYDIYPLGLAYHRGSLYLVGQKVSRSRLPGGTSAPSDASTPRLPGGTSAVRRQ